MGHFSWDPIFGVYALMACFVAGAACFLAWAVRSGAMRDDESPKYRMLEEDGVRSPGGGGARERGDHDEKA